MSILLTAPEITPTRTKADLVGLGLNRETKHASLRLLLTANDGSAPSYVTFYIEEADFQAFLMAASIDKRAIEQFIANTFLSGSVT